MTQFLTRLHLILFKKKKNRVQNPVSRFSPLGIFYDIDYYPLIIHSIDHASFQNLSIACALLPRFFLSGKPKQRDNAETRENNSSQQNYK